MNFTMKKTVLIVDDEVAMQKMLKCALGSSFSIITASNGAEALQLLKDGLDIDAMLTDVNMPGTGGIDLLDEAHRFRPDLPIILLTGYGGMEEYLEVMNKGAFEYLPKPFPVSHLMGTLQRAVAA